MPCYCPTSLPTSWKILVLSKQISVLSCGQQYSSLLSLKMWLPGLQICVYDTCIGHGCALYGCDQRNVSFYLVENVKFYIRSEVDTPILPVEPPKADFLTMNH